MATPRVLVVQRILPPYRLPFFRRLAASSQMSLTIAYGEAAVGSALESVTPPSDLAVVRLGNLYGGSRELGVWQQGMLSLLKSNLYDVVIAEFNPRIVSNVLGCFWRQRLPLQWIWWGHGISPQSNAISIRLRVWLSRLADALIFYEATQQAKFVSWGVAQEKTFVANNSIDTEDIDPLVEARPCHERHRILYIGRLIPQKKIALLIHGFAHALSSLPPETKLTLVGDGTEREALERLVHELNIGERVEFVGAVYQQTQLAPLFNSAWVSVSPGYIGLSAIHSLAYGVPLLVAKGEPHSPEQAALEEGTNSVFFPSDDVTALGKQLVSLANDSVRWNAMAVAARQKIQASFSLSAMVRTFEQAVQQVHCTSQKKLNSCVANNRLA
jgi:glycosyltransferase involved in cell wall biosynthesis